MIKKGYYILAGLGLVLISQVGQRFGCSMPKEPDILKEEVQPKNPFQNPKISNNSNTELTDSDLPPELADKVTNINQTNVPASTVPVPPVSPNVAKATVANNQNMAGQQIPANSGGFMGTLLSNLLGVNNQQQNYNQPTYNQPVNNQNNQMMQQNMGNVGMPNVPFNQFLNQIQSKLPYQLDKDVIWQRADLTAPQQLTFSYSMPRALQQQLPATFHQTIEPTFQGWVCSIAPQMLQYGFDVTILLYDKQNQLADRFFIGRDFCPR